MAAVRTPGPGKTIGEDAALEVAPELALHVDRHALPVLVILPCEREVSLQMLLDDSVEGRLLGMSAGIRGSSASL
jgi:hypothetical protein